MSNASTHQKCRDHALQAAVAALEHDSMPSMHAPCHTRGCHHHPRNHMHPEYNPSACHQQRAINERPSIHTARADGYETSSSMHGHCSDDGHGTDLEEQGTIPLRRRHHLDTAIIAPPRLHDRSTQRPRHLLVCLMVLSCVACTTTIGAAMFLLPMYDVHVSRSLRMPSVSRVGAADGTPPPPPSPRLNGHQSLRTVTAPPTEPTLSIREDVLRRVADIRPHRSLPHGIDLLSLRRNLSWWMSGAIGVHNRTRSSNPLDLLAVVGDLSLAIGALLQRVEQLERMELEDGTHT